MSSVSGGLVPPQSVPSRDLASERESRTRQLGSRLSQNEISKEAYNEAVTKMNIELARLEAAKVLEDNLHGMDVDDDGSGVGGPHSTNGNSTAVGSSSSTKNRMPPPLSVHNNLGGVWNKVGNGNFAKTVMSIPDALKKRNVKVADFEVDPDDEMLAHTYSMSKLPPAGIGKAIKQKFKSNHICQPNILRIEDQQILKTSITLGFSKRRSSSAKQDYEDAKEFSIKFGKEVYTFKAEGKEDGLRQGATFVPRLIKSIFLYNTSIYFANNKKLIKEALEDYAEIDLDRTMVVEQNGVFGGTIRVFVKKYLSAPPVSIEVPECGFDGKPIGKCTRKITVRANGLGKDMVQTFAQRKESLECWTCRKAGLAFDHDFKKCEKAKKRDKDRKCIECAQKGCPRGKCKNVEAIIRGTDFTQHSIAESKSRLTMRAKRRVHMETSSFVSEKTARTENMNPIDLSGPTEVASRLGPGQAREEAPPADSSNNPRNRGNDVKVVNPVANVEKATLEAVTSTTVIPHDNGTGEAVVKNALIQGPMEPSVNDSPPPLDSGVAESRNANAGQGVSAESFNSCSSNVTTLDAYPYLPEKEKVSPTKTTSSLSLLNKVPPQGGVVTRAKSQKVASGVSA